MSVYDGVKIRATDRCIKLSLCALHKGMCQLYYKEKDS